MRVDKQYLIITVRLFWEMNKIALLPNQIVEWLRVPIPINQNLTNFPFF